MSLIIIEGLDCTGKSTVASFLQEKHGYEVIHMSAPKEGEIKDNYINEMIEVISSSAVKNIVLDRSYYGELVWPHVFNRKPLIGEEDIEILKEIEDSVGEVDKILMIDKNIDAHWKRCVDNNEPLTKAQFLKARSLYNQVASNYGFRTLSLPDFISSNNLNPEKYLKDIRAPKKETTSDSVLETDTKKNSSASSLTTKTKEQVLLEKANAINSILSKRILKMRGDVYEELESEIRDFLNFKLSQIFGKNEDSSFTKEEILFFKTMYKKAINK